MKNMRMEFIGIKEFRRNMKKLCEKARKGEYYYIVTSHQKPIFKAMPVLKGTKLSDLIKD